jgi:glycosyltransferase involved in cell wall biosynthesis
MSAELRVHHMKVLLINNDKGWSGGQEHLKDLASELVRHGVEVHFVVRAGSKSDSRFRGLGVSVHPLPGHGMGDVKALWMLARLMRREHFDIVSVNREHDLLLTVLARNLAFPVNKPGKLMMSYHTATARKQFFLGSADAVLCISRHVRDKLLRGNPGAALRTSIVYYGIQFGSPPAADKFARDRKRRYFTGIGFPLIGMVGEFWKNQSELVDAIPIMKKDFPGLKVALVGDNSDQGLFVPLMEKIQRMGLEKDVIFTGRIPRERIPDVFYDFDLSVTTHRNEGFGIVHLESLAAGTPVVTYDEGGMVDIFQGEEVGEVVAGGPADFAAAVTRLLQDDPRRFALGRNGYDLISRHYSLAAMGRRYLEFYRRLLGEGGCPD